MLPSPSPRSHWTVSIHFRLTKLEYGVCIVCDVRIVWDCARVNVIYCETPTHREYCDFNCWNWNAETYSSHIVYGCIRYIVHTYMACVCVCLCVALVGSNIIHEKWSCMNGGVTGIVSASRNRTDGKNNALESSPILRSFYLSAGHERKLMFVFCFKSSSSGLADVANA